MDLNAESLRWMMTLEQIEARFEHMQFEDDERVYINLWIALQRSALQMFRSALDQPSVVGEVFFNLYYAHVKEASEIGEIVHALLKLKEPQ